MASVACVSRAMVFPLLAALIPFQKYLRLGMDLSQGQWMTAGRPFTSSPFYIWWVGVLHGGMGMPASGLILVQMASGVLMCVFCHRIALRFMSRMVSFIAGACVALTASPILYEGQILSESWAVLFNVAGLWAFLKAQTTRAPHGAFVTCKKDLLAPPSSPSPSRGEGILDEPGGRFGGQWLLSAGLCMGVSVIIRPNAFLLVLVVLCFLVNLPIRKALRTAAFLLIGVLLPVLPVAWHNFRTTHAFIPVSTSAGIVSYASWCPEAPGLGYAPPEANGEIERLLIESSLRQDPRFSSSPIWKQAMSRLQAMGVSSSEIEKLTGPDVALGYPYEHDAGRLLASLAAGRDLSWQEADRFYRQEAWKVILKYPARSVRLAFSKVLFTFNSHSSHDTQPAVISGILMAPWERWSSGLVLGLAWVFLPSSIRRVPMVWGFLLAYQVSMVLLYTMARFRLPMMPFLVLAAGAGVEGGLRAIREGSLRTRALWIAWACLCAGIVSMPWKEIRRDQEKKREFAISYWWGRARGNDGAWTRQPSDSQKRLARISPHAVEWVNRILSEKEDPPKDSMRTLSTEDSLETALEIAKAPESAAWGHYLAAVQCQKQGKMDLARAYAQHSFDEGGKFLVVEQSFDPTCSIAQHLRRLSGEGP